MSAPFDVATAIAPRWVETTATRDGLRVGWIPGDGGGVRMVDVSCDQSSASRGWLSSW